MWGVATGAASIEGGGGTGLFFYLFCEVPTTSQCWAGLDSQGKS